MSITDSLYRLSGFACVLALCVNLNVDLEVVGTLYGACLNGIHTVDLVPSALHLGWTAHGRVPTTLQTYRFI